MICALAWIRTETIKKAFTLRYKSRRIERLWPTMFHMVVKSIVKAPREIKSWNTAVPLTYVSGFPFSSSVTLSG